MRDSNRIFTAEREMLIRGQKHILESGFFLDVRELAERFCVQAEWLAPALSVWVGESRIFKIEYDGCSLFPSYAFSTKASITPQAGLQEVVTILSQMKGGWAMAFWFISPNSFLGGRRPQDLLAQMPHQVVLAAQDEVEGNTHG
ncbi:hypothetical protein SAMN04490202_2616 [Pseudomonas reinekei]|mgnify:CR=1 FL=1|uniref:DUF2384 domain-containing protein n=2 Tax=Pseudomonas reinekei TaxID=395598 RepID=A0A1H0PC20_PSERE|nr:hypothetical protein SAMN04490202_2616 [Pseudomonas reinekei]